MDLLTQLEELAESCPDYPSLSHPGLPRGFVVRIPGIETPVPVEVLQRAVLADPRLMVTLCLGLDLEPFHETWLTWCFRHPISMVEAPRGFGKSTICTTAFVITLICRDFDTRVLITSERDDQVVGFLSEIRSHLETSAMLQTLFGSFVGGGKWTDHKLVIAQRRKLAQKEGTLDAICMGGGAVTGRHWEVVIVDDPTSQKTAWSPSLRDKSFAYYFSTLKPTLMPGGYLQVRCTRYHFEDLAGRIEREIAIGRGTGDAYVYHYEDLLAGDVMIPRNARMKILKTSAILRDETSLWEARSPLKDRVGLDGTVTEGLLSIKADMGSRAFGEQYQMECRPPDENRVRETECKEAWLPTWDRPPMLKTLDVVLRADPAWTDAEKAARMHTRDRKPSWSAIAAVGRLPRAARGESSFFVLEVEAGLWSTVELTSRLRSMANAWALKLGRRRLRVGIERTGLQIRAAPQFYADIRRDLAPHRVEFINPRMEKLAYARPFFVSSERGEVRLSPTVAESGFVQQCGDCPDCDRWDEIDAVAGGYRMLRHHRSSNLRNFAARNQARPGADQASAGNYAAAARGMSGGRRTR